MEKAAERGSSGTHGLLAIPTDHPVRRNRLGGPAPIPKSFGNPTDDSAGRYNPLDQLSAERSTFTQNGGRPCVRRTGRAERSSATGEVSGAWSLASGRELSRQSSGKPVKRALKLRWAQVPGISNERWDPASEQARWRQGPGDTVKRVLVEAREDSGFQGLAGEEVECRWGPGRVGPDPAW
ncbi:hypothetical protein NDU88_002269 [Pleurodeles waltl]|uniref:Uncharacterized protein n=1 Tax=Pleurodeles waltl TaxID=8319 RepID=A0AAV7UCP6_PLEWA|nr:hypothetical protein NDU88_002269 [Pleurodeles waltl]